MQQAAAQHGHAAVARFLLAEGAAAAPALPTAFDAAHAGVVEARAAWLPVCMDGL